MEIKVFGPGCARCSQTEHVVKDAVTATGVAVSIIKVSDMKEMMMAGIMSTPAVTIDGVIKSTGRVPTKDEVISWLEGATASSTVEPSAAGKGACSCGGKSGA